MQLSPRETQVAALIAAGYDNSMIAKQLGVGLRTVKMYAANVYAKVGIPFRGRGTSRTRLGVWWNCELFQIGLPLAPRADRFTHA